ncbi:MAG: class I SAM-dependent methyltransferase, partial [Cytophagales bacterium]|nr:class I SAM-dependent methyltransferase [Cytophagales bacterium]
VSSVDLVLAVNTAHWLNLDKYFQECEKVLKPNGIIAIGGYALPIPKLATEIGDAGIANEKANVELKSAISEVPFYQSVAI